MIRETRWLIIKYRYEKVIHTATLGVYAVNLTLKHLFYLFFGATYLQDGIDHVEVCYYIVVYYMIPPFQED